MSFISNMINFRENRAKRDTLHQLRCMSDRMLADCNISPELLQKGVKAWPWQNETDQQFRIPVERPLRADVDTLKNTGKAKQITENEPMPEQLHVSQRNAA